MEQFIKSLSHIPDDKLKWSPAPTAKSAIQIAAHTAVAAGNFADLLRDRKLPGADALTAFLEETAAAEKAITTIEEAEAVYRKNTDEIIAALDALSAEDVELSLDSSFGWSMPMTFLMSLPALHAMAHASQLDYLQTCWDDQEIYFTRKAPL